MILFVLGGVILFKWMENQTKSQMEIMGILMIILDLGDLMKNKWFYLTEFIDNIIVNI